MRSGGGQINKNLMNMDQVMRAAKIKMKGGGDLVPVIVDESSLQCVISEKLIPSINKVAMGLLKWSYTEANYTFPDVFSAWADLDAGFMQLLQEYHEERTKYKQSFKAIIEEAKKVSEVQKEKERTANKISTTSSKLEAARKTLKKNKNNEKARLHVSTLEAHLYQASAKDEETEELLRNVTAEFECFKASMLKDSLITHCQSFQNLLQKGTDLIQVKMEIAKSMPDEPAMRPDPTNDNNMKVEAVFKKHHLQLPPRDPTVERNLPAQRFKTLPPQPNFFPPNSPKFIKKSSLPASVVSKGHVSPGPTALPDLGKSFDSDDEDDDDYSVPTEDITTRSSLKPTPPELPPRNVVEEEDYVDPSVCPKFPLALKAEAPPPSPRQKPLKTDTDYIEVISDEETDRSPLSPHRKISNQSWSQNDGNALDPVSEPIPPDETDTDTNSNQLYGNLTNEKLEEYKASASDVKQGKMRKPAVFPKPVHKQSKGASRGRRQDSASSKKDSVAVKDFFPLISDDNNTPNKTGASSSPLSPTKQHFFVEPDHLGQETETKHTYFDVADLLHQDSFDSASETDNSNTSHTYFNVRKMGGEEMYGSDPNLYYNVPGAEQQTTQISNSKPSPLVAKKPIALPRKPSHAVRGEVK